MTRPCLVGLTKIPNVQTNNRRGPDHDLHTLGRCVRVPHYLYSRGPVLIGKCRRYDVRTTCSAGEYHPVPCIQYDFNFKGVEDIGLGIVERPRYTYLIVYLLIFHNESLHLRPLGHKDRPMALETASIIPLCQELIIPSSHSLISANRFLLFRSSKYHALPTMYFATLLSFLLLPGASLSRLPNFWLTYMKLDSYDPHYRHQAGGVFTTPSGDPSWACDDATYDSGIFPNRDDVSGNKLGMRCDPSRDVGFPLYRDPLDVVEFNTGKFWAGHQTIYSDRDYGLYDLDDRKTAQCYGEQNFPTDSKYHIERHTAT
ncbi:hypothetical protein CIB48_g224 [Xylaria polymorpha]|nr:hypothetical protein CIB48_g224 [Xylaria polymorpha]